MFHFMNHKKTSFYILSKIKNLVYLVRYNLDIVLALPKKVYILLITTKIVNKI